MDYGLMFRNVLRIPVQRPELPRLKLVRIETLKPGDIFWIHNASSPEMRRRPLVFETLVRESSLYSTIPEFRFMIVRARWRKRVQHDDIAEYYCGPYVAVRIDK